MFNCALLGKLLWLYVHERGAWQRIVVDAKYSSSWGGWCSIEPSGPFAVGLWKNIKKRWMMFSSHTRFEIGDNSNIRFWHDAWCGEKALKEVFSYLFSISCVKDCFSSSSFGVF